MGSSNLRGALMALIGFAVFASHDVVVKWLGAHYSAFQIVFFSVLLSFPLATLMMIGDAKPGHLRPVHPWWTALRTAATVITGVAAFYAFSVLPLAQTYAILFASPLIVTVLAIPILGEKVRLRRWLAALAAAVCSALASVIVRKIGHEERSVVLLLYPMVANFVLMGLAMPFVYRPMPIEHLGGVGLIAMLAFIATILMISAYKNAEAAIVAPMQYSQIIWAAIFGALFFQERPDAQTALGAAIIIASGLYIVFRESRSSASENTPVLRTRSRPETGTTLRLGPLLRLRGISR